MSATKFGRFDILENALQEFRCNQDKDIEDFLHTKAIDFLKRGWCSTYLLINRKCLKAKILKVDAYFTLSHKILSVGDNLSKTQVKYAGGFKDLKSLHFVLIGQLGKYIDGKKRANVSSKYILDKAFGVIYASSGLIPCRCVMVECKDKAKLKEIYENYGFEFFQQDGYLQYIKLLKKPIV